MTRVDVLPQLQYALMSYWNRRNMLISCVLYNYYRCVCLLLQLEFNFDSNLLYKCLLKACVSNQSNMVIILLESRLTLDDIRSNNNYLLGITSKLGFANIVRLLLKRGLTMEDISANYDYAIVAAIRRGHVQVVALFIEHGLSLFSIEFTWTLAIEYGHVEIVELFLNHGLTPETIVANYTIAMQIATKNNRMHSVLFLTQMKSFVDNKHRLCKLLAMTDKFCTCIQYVIFVYGLACVYISLQN